MEDSFGNDRALPRAELHGSAFEIDQQLPFDNVEKLVVIVVLVPMIFALDDSKTNHRPIHLAKRLVEPLIGARTRERFFVNEFQWLMKDVESRLVRDRKSVV